MYHSKLDCFSLPITSTLVQYYQARLEPTIGLRSMGSMGQASNLVCKYQGKGNLQQSTLKFIVGPTFYGRNLRIFFIGQSVCPWQALPAQANILQVRPKHTRVKHLSGAPLQGRLLTLPTNLRLGLKGLPGTNILAYYENP